MKKAMFGAEIKFLPTSVDKVWIKKLCFQPNVYFYPLVWRKKAIFWAEMKFLRTSVEEKSYARSQYEVPTPAKIVPFIRYLRQGGM